MRPVVVNSSQKLVEPALMLTVAERRQIVDLARSVEADPKADPESFCMSARTAAQGLPERVWNALQLFARWGSSTGVLLIEGLPVGPVPSTPVDNSYHLVVLC